MSRNYSKGYVLCKSRILRAALTLLELLVVLVILSIVATVAVNSLQPRVEAQRFEQTRSQLDNILASTVGGMRKQLADGTPLLSGFVADIGRLPKADFAAFANQRANGNELSELWDIHSPIAQNFPFRFRSGPAQPVDYSHIQLPCGWRGPYLHLPIGQSRVVDSWGKPFRVATNLQSEIESVSWQTKPPFDEPMACNLNIGKVNISGTLNSDQVEPSSIEVVFLSPNPDTSTAELAVYADEDTSQSTFTFTNVSIGLRAIHIKFDGGEITKYVQVPHEGLSLVIDLSKPTNAVP